MTYQKIVFTKPGVAEVLQDEIGDPNPHEVQVRLVYSTISSGTERAKLTGSKTITWRTPEAKEAVFPRITGYSSSGVVVKNRS